MNIKMQTFLIPATRALLSVAMRTTVVLIALLLPLAARAEPIKLKFSFFTSDRSYIYQNSIKPFVDAINKEGKGLVEIEMYFSGTISSVQADQPQLVTDGIADLALIVPGRTPQKFSDTAVMELPGLYRDQREASLVFTRLTEAGDLKGYENFFVVGAFVADSKPSHPQTGRVKRRSQGPHHSREQSDAGEGSRKTRRYSNASRHKPNHRSHQHRQARRRNLPGLDAV